MTTQTSQPNGDGQLLRGAQALRLAARNALTARGPVEPAEPVEPEQHAEAEVPAAPAAVAAVAPAGWSETGWHQNVRLLTAPPAEPDPPHEGEPPPGPMATPERVDLFAKAPAEPERVAEPEPEPEHGFADGPEACYGGTASEVADIVEWASAERDRERQPEFVSVELPVESGTSLFTAAAESPAEPRAMAVDVLEPPAAEAGPSAPAAYAEPASMPETEERPEVAAEPEPDLYAEVPETDAPWPDDGDDEDEAAVAASIDDDPSDHGPGVSSGIPAPVWNVTVPAGSGSVVPTRAALTFDSRRWSPLIVGEATHEIPVHLLFREEGVASAPTAGRPQLRRGPAVATPPAPPVLAPAAVSRPATPVDTKLVERPGPTLPGWTAALAGVAGLFSCLTVLWWVGAVPEALTEMFGLGSNPYNGIGIGMWALLALAVTLTLFAFGGLGRGRVGHAWVLTLFGEYRGSVRRTGLLWVSPLLLRRRVDVRLRHWRSEPMPAVDANGTALRVVVLVVWRVRDTVRAALGVRDHEEYLREQVEAAMARVLSQLPADAFNETAPTLRNAELVGEALTRMLSAECRPVGLDIFSAQPTRIEYAPEISAAMQRSRIAAIDARHRDTVLTSVVDAVDDTVHRLTSRGLVELDDYERKVLVKDLTVAFYTGRHGLNEGS
ncbi:SPFH domain-containing protein [Streptomyces sp. NBC_01716]|uniref:SPFH domain-containing protein n=1 Tax=Streptomyces sp. NBC_01716 TaxID=2975917 RepID=UPI002E31B19B|nr:SPFH domain-containing protein [Streptomyces sp. NBC_01716]